MERDKLEAAVIKCRTTSRCGHLLLSELREIDYEFPARYAHVICLQLAVPARRSPVPSDSEFSSRFLVEISSYSII